MKLFTSLLLMLLLTACGGARDLKSDEAAKPKEPTAPKQVIYNDNEQVLKKMLNGATLNGVFTMKGKNNLDGVAKDTYVISAVDKVDEERWRFMVRITYLKTDINVPLFLPIKWAGDTAIVYVDKVFVPGAGTYSARVAFYKDQYAGVWEGDGYGGQLMGTIEPLKEKKN